MRETINELPPSLSLSQPLASAATPLLCQPPTSQDASLPASASRQPLAWPPDRSKLPSTAAKAIGRVTQRNVAK